MPFSRAFVAMIFTGVALLCSVPAEAAQCFETMIQSPTPFMGNNDETFVLSDGSVWQVKYEYEYLYEYYPAVTICPDRGQLVINGKSLNVVPISGPSRPRTPVRSPKMATVVYREPGCDYFIADGPKGLYILEWYRGHDPEVGETFVGYDGGYGFRDVVYTARGSDGRIYADDYLLSEQSAIKKLIEKCK